MGWKPLGLVSLAAVSLLACSHIFQEVDSTTNPNSPSSTASATPSPIPIVVVPVIYSYLVRDARPRAHEQMDVEARAEVESGGEAGALM